MSLNNIILLSGRPENGNTQMLIAYANMHPTTTLYISLASTHGLLLSKGLKPEVVVIDKVPLKDALIDNYETICIDYLEVGNKDDIKKFILKELKKNKKVILASKMKRYGKVSDIFEEISEDRMFIGKHLDSFFAIIYSFTDNIMSCLKMIIFLLLLDQYLVGYKLCRRVHLQNPILPLSLLVEEGNDYVLDMILQYDIL